MWSSLIKHELSIRVDAYNTWCQEVAGPTMATFTHFTLIPPAAFNFHQPEEWKKWLTRFEQFRIAFRLSIEPGERQASSLLYCMGVNAVDVLATTNISNNDKKDILQQGGKEVQWIFQSAKKYHFQTCQLQSSEPTGWWNSWAIHHKITPNGGQLQIWQYGKWNNPGSPRHHHTQSTAFRATPDGTWIDTGNSREAYSPKSRNWAAATEVESPSWNKALVIKYEQRATNSPSKQETH